MGQHRIGVVGCGGMGSWHGRNVAGLEGASLVAVADAHRPSAEALAADTGAEVIEAHALISSPDVDAVIIASSDDSHAEYATAAIAGGKRVLLEKPLADSLAGAEAVLRAEVEAGRRLVQVGFMREVDPAHAELEAAIAPLGDLTRIRCVHRNVDAEPRPVKALFAQSLIHDIHTVRWLSGDEFASVTVHVVERADGFRDVLLVGELLGGGLAVIEFEDQAFAYEVQVEVTAMGGMAATLPHPRVVVRSGASESLAVGTDWFARFADAYRIEIEQWVDSLDGEATGPSVWDGYAAQLVADGAERSMTIGLGAAGTGFDATSRIKIDTPPRPDLYR